ncbi:hypothetical protein EMIHUDRAFT_211720 [Emiliania huxleyi CCMP1516]|uniref:Uncharacterized protein n=2 Tax=Emiliania huxleyi TaxID=2903 RepID=A0A0D3ISU0_EMIH1|nr:hypothetical protein EMIHUDRAFT_211720 [Emiliania huxleyi CCMP1516]EOD14325.1 hypothetical protein EMIHUDRAFT_211720 [Emiliania huxleyi CCMP1516]|eukprot:XP_005766754.1 hypothetical protein EMIHUDRAFT_211720 [Emiliania huxleyi CCMP1516]
MAQHAPLRLQSPNCVRGAGFSFGGGTRRQQAANIGNRQSVTQRVVFGAL